MTTTVPQRQRFLFATLWSALFAKCFILEYFTHKYQVPINTTIYVWSLSILMATTASIAYLKPDFGRLRKLEHIKLHQLIWVCGALAVTIVVITQSQLVDTPNALAIASIIIGTCTFIQGYTLKQLSAVTRGIGWWICAAIEFRTLPPNHLLTFSICILVCSTLPNTLNYFRCSLAQRTAC